MSAEVFPDPLKLTPKLLKGLLDYGSLLDILFEARLLLLCKPETLHLKGEFTICLLLKKLPCQNKVDQEKVGINDQHIPINMHFLV